MRFRILRGFGGSFFLANPLGDGSSIARTSLGRKRGLRAAALRDSSGSCGEVLAGFCRRDFRAFRARRSGHSNSGAAFNAASARLPPRFGGAKLKPALGVAREPPLVFERLVNLYYFF